jgi:hypothetical protein
VIVDHAVVAEPNDSLSWHFSDDSGHEGTWMVDEFPAAVKAVFDRALYHIFTTINTGLIHVITILAFKIWTIHGNDWIGLLDFHLFEV